MTDSAKTERYGPIVAEVESARTGDVYQIRLNGDGRLSCNCKGWAFRKSCKHTRAQTLDSVLDGLKQQPSTEAEIACQAVREALGVEITLARAAKLLTTLRARLGPSWAAGEATQPAPCPAFAVRRIRIDD